LTTDSGGTLSKTKDFDSYFCFGVTVLPAICSSRVQANSLEHSAARLQQGGMSSPPDSVKRDEAASTEVMGQTNEHTAPGFRRNLYQSSPAKALLPEGTQWFLISVYCVYDTDHVHAAAFCFVH